MASSQSLGAKKFKIMIIGMPMSGHLTPLRPILKELLNTGCIEILIYISKEKKELVESLGAKYRPMINNLNEMSTQIDHGTDGVMHVLSLMNALISITKKNTVYLAREIEKESPDLIIYDFLCLHAKWAFAYYKKWHQIGATASPKKAEKMRFRPIKPLPDVIAFSASFTFCKGVYPNRIEIDLGLTFKYSFGELREFFKLLVNYQMLCVKFGILVNPVDCFPTNQPSYVKQILTSVIPELQPRSHLFNEKLYKFIGSTIDGNMPDLRVNDEFFVGLLRNFQIRDRQLTWNASRNGSGSMLVFVSLGTVFNKVLSHYRSIIDAFRFFDAEESEYKSDHIKMVNLSVVISAGGDQGVYEELVKLRSDESFQIPDNIIMVKSAPQLEILKRASLFVTHCGMNSTSESIHFGVPMLCVPIAADQSAVAYRVADELGLGLRADIRKNTFRDLRRAMHRILGDETFYERVARFSEVSHRHNGAKNAANCIMKHLF